MMWSSWKVERDEAKNHKLDDDRCNRKNETLWGARTGDLGESAIGTMFKMVLGIRHELSAFLLV
jgi:hypothetical protein